MKFRAFKFAEDEKVKDRGAIFEGLLFKACIVFFCILITIQLIFAIPFFRSRLNLTDKSIGVPLNNDEYLYNQGQVTLELIAESPDPTVKILVNGDEVATFESLEMPLNVKDGDVIEIDGSNSTSGHIVRVGETSSNVNSKCMDAVTRVETNIQKLVKVKVD